MKLQLSDRLKECVVLLITVNVVGDKSVELNSNCHVSIQSSRILEKPFL